MWMEVAETEILLVEEVVASLELVVEQELDNSHHKGIFHPIIIKSTDIIKKPLVLGFNLAIGEFWKKSFLPDHEFHQY